MTDDDLRGLVHAQAIRDFRRSEDGSTLRGRVISRGIVGASAEQGATPSTWLVRDEAGDDHAIVATEWTVLPP